LDESHTGKVFCHEPMVLGSRHVPQGSTTDRSSIRSQTSIMSKLSWVHGITGLRARSDSDVIQLRSESVGLDISGTRAGSTINTRSDQNRVLVSGMKTQTYSLFILPKGRG
jgi:hypothetical protein